MTQQGLDSLLLFLGDIDRRVSYLNTVLQSSTLHFQIKPSENEDEQPSQESKEIEEERLKKLELAEASLNTLRETIDSIDRVLFLARTMRANYGLSAQPHISTSSRNESIKSKEKKEDITPVETLIRFQIGTFPAKYRAAVSMNKELKEAASKPQNTSKMRFLAKLTTQSPSTLPDHLLDEKESKIRVSTLIYATTLLLNHIRALTLDENDTAINIFIGWYRMKKIISVYSELLKYKHSGQIETKISEKNDIYERFFQNERDKKKSTALKLNKEDDAVRVLNNFWFPLEDAKWKQSHPTSATYYGLNELVELKNVQFEMQMTLLRLQVERKFASVLFPMLKSMKHDEKGYLRLLTFVSKVLNEGRGFSFVPNENNNKTRKK